MALVGVKTYKREVFGEASKKSLGKVEHPQRNGSLWWFDRSTETKANHLAEVGMITNREDCVSMSSETLSAVGGTNKKRLNMAVHQNLRPLLE